MQEPSEPPNAEPAITAPKKSLGATLLDFLVNMDASAWRTLWVTLALFVVVGVLLVFGRLLYGDQIEAFVQTWLGGAERAHWGLPAAILAFCVSAFFGVPQFVLIVACALAFGPEKGFWYAWIATIVSGAVTYSAGRLTNAQNLLKPFAGATGGRFSRFMRNNAFLAAFGASFIVRFLPTAPFVVVNMGMAAAGLRFIPFMLGLTIGVLPKTAVVAFAWDGVLDAAEGRWGAAAIAGGIAIALWVFGVVLIRRLIRGDQPARSDEDPIA